MHNLVYNIIDCSISFVSVFDIDNNKDGRFAWNKEIIFYENFEKMLLVCDARTKDNNMFCICV